MERRTFLRGLGTVMALPLLESLPGIASLRPRGALAAEGASVPSRLAFLYVPNGVHMADWTPAAAGAEFTLPATLEPLAAVKQELLVLTGLTQDKARPNGDGPGDHARAAASFLTGAQAVKTAGANIKVGISADQVAAGRIGHLTRFPSLELGVDRGQQSGNCDSGYSCAYSSNIAWKTESTPVAKEINPRLVFERLFGSGSEADARRGIRDRYRKSVLDFVREDARRLQPRLGAADRGKLDEYFTAVREVEERIAKSAGAETRGPDGFAPPAGIPKDHEEHIRLLLDLLVLAFRTDQTRVATFMFANEGSNRSYPFLDVSEGHHDLSHHGGNQGKQAKIQKINAFHVRQLAYFLETLHSIREGEGTLLDHAMIVYGSGISDGNRHNHNDLPVLVAGRGCGTIQSGRHVVYPKNTPLNNLFLSLLDRLEAPSETLGDSTGRLPHLYAAARSF